MNSILVPFLNSLNEKVVYCHWKSNMMLNGAESGKTDLDLLIKKDHRSKFENISSKIWF